MFGNDSGNDKLQDRLAVTDSQPASIYTGTGGKKHRRRRRFPGLLMALSTPPHPTTCLDRYQSRIMGSTLISGHIRGFSRIRAASVAHG